MRCTLLVVPITFLLYLVLLSSFRRHNVVMNDKMFVLFVTNRQYHGYNNGARSLEKGINKE